MPWIVRSIRWIMLVSGIFTATMDAAIADAAMRNWGAPIGLVSAMLIYGAFKPAVRPLVLVVAGVSNHSEQETLQTIRSLRSSGESMEGIAGHLNRHGVATRAEGMWRFEYIRRLPRTA